MIQFISTFCFDSDNNKTYQNNTVLHLLNIIDLATQMLLIN